MQHMPLLVSECTSSDPPAPELTLVCRIADNAISILSGILYWYIWTVFVPSLKGYTLEEETDILDDGTTVTTLTKVPLETQL